VRGPLINCQRYGNLIILNILGRLLNVGNIIESFEIAALDRPHIATTSPRDEHTNLIVLRLSLNFRVIAPLFACSTTLLLNGSTIVRDRLGDRGLGFDDFLGVLSIILNIREVLMADTLGVYGPSRENFPLLVFALAHSGVTFRVVI
jgi:hypothetical protein